MKRLIIAVLLLILGNVAFCAPQKEIKFIYINGSNNNDEKMKNWFFDGVYKLHPELRKNFLESEFSQKHFLQDNCYTVAKEPIPFFWGNKSALELDRVLDGLDMTKLFSPKVAQMVRSCFAHFLHDAIWVQKYHNMKPILNDLHKQVVNETKDGDQVVLYGYSAGSFITYQYLLNKLPNINLNDFFTKVKVSEFERNFVKANPRKNTCIDALVDSKIAVLSMDGHLIPNVNTNLFIKNYSNLDEYTASSCIPPNSVKGIVNFASPLVLFYSDISDPSYELNYYNKLLYEYLIENNMFWLTVNYSEDPLGFPSSRNLTQEELEFIAHIDIDPHLGFMYDKSDFKSRRTFMGAHTAYWSTAKHFSKEVVKAYQEGLELYYPEFKND